MSAAVTILPQPSPKPDFVNVRLTDAGREFAGKSGQVHVANAHMAYTFKDDEAQRVVYRGEWTSILSRESFNGKAIFEIVPDPAPQPAGIVVPAVTNQTATSQAAAAAAQPGAIAAQPVAAASADIK